MIAPFARITVALPKSKIELQRVIGIFSYYANWLSDFSLKTKPLIESNKNNLFPFSNESAKVFEILQSELASVCLNCVNEGLFFTVECDGSNHTLAASINQGGYPIAFPFQIFSPC